MVMAVVSREEAEGVLKELIAGGHTATYMESRGGMLRQSQLTMFIAVDAERLENVISIVRDYCHRSVDVETEESRRRDEADGGVKAMVGGSAIFVWDLQSFETC